MTEQTTPEILSDEAPIDEMEIPPRVDIFGVAYSSPAKLRKETADAATRMRDLCVAKVREMQAAFRKRNLDRDESNRPDSYRINILEQAVEQLESLTLDSVQKELEDAPKA